MASYSVDPGPDKLSNLQSQVNDVKGIMTHNIEKVLDRGEKLDDLIIKTDDLQATEGGGGFGNGAEEVYQDAAWIRGLILSRKHPQKLQGRCGGKTQK
ncbi:vesicle-associated membrane protein 8 isoform X2 [Pristis pectinata]|uniref:vesicle-associated membrane protein 8 isoform X2 n=1 Tax=Pristis pectinata TaxID=685728 RepID=UPI00223CD521|nr:vesicle-associated membrane protein 8 isoform X2 [Pristis pectinata]